MKRLWVTAIVGMLLLGVCGGAAFGALSEAQKQAVHALIKQFSAREFNVRQQAVKRLIEIGPDVLPIIGKTLKETTDNEVKTRCRMVLKGIADKHGVELNEPDAPAAKSLVGAGLEPSKVTIDVTGTPLSEVLDMLAEQSGNRMMNAAANLADKPVTLHVKEMFYWQAVDELCKTAGLIYRMRWGRGGASGLMLTEAEPVEAANAYAGPAVLTLDSVTNTRILRRARTGVGGRAMPMRWQGDGLRYTISYFWEDRLPVLTSQAEFTKAVTPDGKDLLAADKVPQAMARMTTSFGGGARSSGTTSLRVGRPPEGLRKLTEVTGVLKLHFGTGQTEARFEGAPAKEGKTIDSGKWSLTVEKVTRQPNNNINMTVVLKKDGKPVEKLQTSRAGAYGVFLVGPDGERHRGYTWGGYGRAGAIRRVQVQVGGGANVRVVENAGEQKEARHTIGFYGLKDVDVDGNWSLIFVFPAQEETKEYPFTFKDVPLP